jgi:hypothetical protein
MTTRIYTLIGLLVFIYGSRSQNLPVTNSQTVVSCKNTTIFRCGMCQSMQQVITPTGVPKNNSISWQCYQCGGNSSNNSKTFQATLNTATLITMPLVNDISSGCTSDSLIISGSDERPAYAILGLLLFISLGAVIAMMIYFVKSKKAIKTEEKNCADKELLKNISKSPDTEKQSLGGIKVTPFDEEITVNPNIGKKAGTFRPDKGGKKKDTAPIVVDLARSNLVTASTNKPPSKNKPTPSKSSTTKLS